MKATTEASNETRQNGELSPKKNNTKKFIALGCGLSLILLFGLAAVFLPAIGRLRQKALEIESANELKERRLDDLLDDTSGTLEGSSDEAVMTSESAVSNSGQQPSESSLGWTSDPNDPQKVYLEHLIRSKVFKPKGDLNEDDLKKVSNLMIAGTVDDEGLKLLPKLTELKNLMILNADFTDQGLKEIAKIKGLQTLEIAGSNITDDGLTAITKLSELITLTLVQHPQLTNQGLNNLSEMTNLKQLLYIKTQATEEGFNMLKDKLPNLQIFSE
tara:strand:+ start:277 stop:1095 length:819 start_codon:yes stop_codon:yes gene_type:complete